MRFRIPNEQKETVTVVRDSAYERSKRDTIAENVICMIVPRSDLVPRSERINVEAGVPVAVTGWIALLEAPNPDIVKGDFLLRSDGTEFRVEGVRGLQGSPVMQFELTEREGL